VVLTHDKILEEIAAGSIVIDPFSEDMVGPASVDLHLDDEIRVITPNEVPIDVVDDVDFLAIGALAHDANRADIAALGDAAAIERRIDAGRPAQGDVADTHLALFA